MTLPVLHVICMDHDAQAADFLGTIGALCSECGPSLAVHLRVRGWSDADLLHGARVIRDRAEEAGSWCVVNGRSDIALGAGTHAVQLGAGALPIEVARALLPSSVRIGASVHDITAARLRAREGCDYLVLGTMYPTSTHPEGPIGGPQLLRACARAVPDVPIIAIGGIDQSRAAQVLAAGATGIAVNRAVWEAADPWREARELVEILEAERTGQSGSIRRERVRNE